MKISNIFIVLAIAICLFAIILGARLLLLKRNIGEFKDYWQTLAETPISDNAFVFVVLGDSAAQGIGASKPTKGYVSLVADYIEYKTGKKVSTINISVSGAKTADVTNKQLLKLKELNITPNLLIVEIGANDVPSYNKDSFTKDFSELLNLLPDGTLVANVPSFSNSRLNKLSKVSDEANQIATDKIKAANKLILVDINKATSNLGIADYAADYFHPSDQAYKNHWAPAFISAIESSDLLLK